MSERTKVACRKARVRYETLQRRQKRYLHIVSNKLQVFLEDYNKDILEFSYLARVDYEDICRIYFDGGDVGFETLCHVSACIDAIRNCRYRVSDWELIDCGNFDKDDNWKRFMRYSGGYELL